MNPIVFCIYHNKCIDGLMAAAVVKRTYPEAEFFAANYNESAPIESLKGKHCIIVDFSYARDVTVQIADASAALLVLDHHKTAQAALAGITHAKANIVFDMDHSGAGLAWDTFYPLATGDARPPLIDMVEDRDLWRFTHEGSKRLHYALTCMDPTPECFAHQLQLSMQNPDHLADLLRQGAAMEQLFDAQIETLKREAFTVEIGGYVVPVINAPYMFASELAGALAEGHPFAATYFFNGKEEVWSLRSRLESGIDVSDIAQQYGGGGHKNAAGFTCNIGSIIH
jgi:oligoribonuclease NrnB/cAMP/cGMP phosphodiesterase (DHH superfamily)